MSKRIYFQSSDDFNTQPIDNASVVEDNVIDSKKRQLDDN